MSLPVRSSTPPKSVPARQRATNSPPPGPPTGGIMRSWACAERTKNNIAADTTISQLRHSLAISFRFFRSQHVGIITVELGIGGAKHFDARFPVMTRRRSLKPTRRQRRVLAHEETPVVFRVGQILRHVLRVRESLGGS